MAAPLFFAVDELKDAGEMRVETALDAALFQECLAGEGALTGPIALALELTQGAEGVLARGRLSGEWELECTRCLTRRKSAYQSSFEAALPADADGVDASEEIR